jgi:hypothetical protein
VLKLKKNNSGSKMLSVKIMTIIFIGVVKHSPRPYPIPPPPTYRQQQREIIEK